MKLSMFISSYLLLSRMKPSVPRFPLQCCMKGGGLESYIRKAESHYYGAHSSRKLVLQLCNPGH